MTGVDGAGRQEGPVAKMTNMRTSMPDLSSVAQDPCSAFFPLQLSRQGRESHERL